MYQKGSEWRKWDLHVHTPFSYLNQEFGDDFDNYVKQLFKKALEKNISAIGITDYFTIEGYKKIKNEYLNNGRKMAELGFGNDKIERIRQILLLPNIEFRLNKLVGSDRINFHVIFSDDVSINNIEENFLREIKFVYEGTPQNEDEKRPLSIQNLQELGKKLKKQHSDFKDKSDIKIGMMNAVVDDTEILKILSNKKSIFEGKYLAFVPADEDLSDISWNSQDHNVRKVIIQKSDGFFSSNQNTREFGLGHKYPKEETRVEKFIEEFKSLKPCIWGSDAKSYEKLFEPDLKRYTWIKSNPTFEGLRQIIYEPEERVFIGDEPEILRRVRENKTKFISSIKIDQQSEYTEDKGIWFKNIDIPLNPGLVAIIGNKGNGKSALTDIISLCGNSHLYSDFSFLKEDKFLKDGLAENFEAELEWENGDRINKKLNEQTDINSPERVRYIPQNFFEKLTNNLETYEFEKTLEKVVFSYIPDEQKLDKKSFSELIDYKKQLAEEDIKKICEKIDGLNKKIIELEEKSHPDYKRQLEEELNLRKKELEEHYKIKPAEVPDPTKDDKISEELKREQEKLNDLNEKLKGIEGQIAETDKNLKELNKIIEELKVINKEVKDIKIQLNEYINKNGERFKKYGLDINEIIKYEINETTIEAKISDQEKKRTELKNKLLTEEEVNSLKNISEEDRKNLKNNSLIVQKKNLEIQIEQISNQLSEPQKKYQKYLDELKKWNKRKNEIEGDENTPNTIKWFEKEINYINQQLRTELDNLRNERLEQSYALVNKKREIVSIYQSFKENIDREIQQFQAILGEYEITIDASLKMDSSFYDEFLRYINQKVKGSFYGKDEGKTILEKLVKDNDINTDDGLKSLLRSIIEYLEKDKREKFNNEDRNIKDQILQEKMWLDFYNYIFSLSYLEPSYELKLGNKKLIQLSPGERGALLIVFYLLLDREEIPLIIDQPEENLDNESVYKILTNFIKYAKKKRQVIIVTHNPNLAIVGDAEQIIYVSIDKANNNKFTFESGSIENPIINKHCSDVLEGTLKAFDTRRLKYLKI